MSTIISTKRLFLLVAAASAFTTLGAFAADPAPCDVPVTSSTASADKSTSAQSPEQPPQKVRIRHNGNIICVSSQAAQAHAKHGDTTLGACQPGDKTGS